MTIQNPEGIIYEFVSHGRFVKVSAVDIATGTETSIVGDAAETQERLEALARQKLQWVMTKNTN